MRHLESVHGPRAHTCKACERQFSRKDKLIEHQRTAHGISYADSTRSRSVLSCMANSIYLPTLNGLSSVDKEADMSVVPSETLNVPSSKSESWETVDVESSQDILSGVQFEEYSLDGIGSWPRTWPQFAPGIEMDVELGTEQSPICLDKSIA